MNKISSLQFILTKIPIYIGLAYTDLGKISDTQIIIVLLYSKLTKKMVGRYLIKLFFLGNWSKLHFGNLQSTAVEQPLV